LMSKGIEASDHGRQAGEAALHEIQVRRQGLGVATLLVLAFLAALGLKIRRLPPPS